MSEQKKQSETSARSKGILLPLLLLLTLILSIVSCMVGYILGQNAARSPQDGRMDTILLLPPEEETGLPPVSLSGRAFYSDGTPYANGKIQLHSQPREAATDSNGAFFFYDVEPGSHTVSILDQGGEAVSSVPIMVKQGDEAAGAVLEQSPGGAYTLTVAVDVALVEMEIEVDPGSGALSLLPPAVVAYGGAVDTPEWSADVTQGVVLTPGGAVVLGDGTIVVPGQGIILPDGSFVTADGAVTGKTPAVPGDSQAGEGGGQTLPGGQTVRSDGTVILPDGTRVSPAGTVLLPEGTVIVPGREVAYPGQEPAPLPPNGGIVGKDGVDPPPARPAAPPPQEAEESQASSEGGASTQEPEGDAQESGGWNGGGHTGGNGGSPSGSGGSSSDSSSSSGSGGDSSSSSGSGSDSSSSSGSGGDSSSSDGSSSDSSGSSGSDPQPTWEEPKVSQGGVAWSELAYINLFSSNDSAADGRLYPGVSGTYRFTVENPNPYPVTFTMTMWEEERNVKAIPFQYRLRIGEGEYAAGGQESWLPAEQLQTKAVTLKGQQTIDYTLDWRWPYEGGSDALDTEIGTSANRDHFVMVKIQIDS